MLNYSVYFWLQGVFKTHLIYIYKTKIIYNLLNIKIAFFHLSTVSIWHPEKNIQFVIEKKHRYNLTDTMLKSFFLIVKINTLNYVREMKITYSGVLNL